MPLGKPFFSSLFGIGLLALSACESKTETRALKIAYPAAGAIVNTQVGLILEKTDLIKKHGYTPEVTAMGTGKELKVALVSGKTEVILTSESNFVVLLGEGFDCQAINSMGSAGKLGLLVKKPEYQKLADLRGKTIAAIFGTSLHQPAIEWAREAGAEVVNLGSIAAMNAALESGAVDAIVSWDPYITEALAKHRARMLKEGTFDLIAVASGRFVRSNPQAVAQVNAILKDAVFHLATHQEEYNRQFAEISKIDVPVIHRASLNNRNYSVKTPADIDFRISPDFLKRLHSSADFLYQAKVIRQKPTSLPIAPEAS